MPNETEPDLIERFVFGGTPTPEPQDLTHVAQIERGKRSEAAFPATGQPPSGQFVEQPWDDDVHKKHHLLIGRSVAHAIDHMMMLRKDLQSAASKVPDDWRPRGSIVLPAQANPSTPGACVQISPYRINRWEFIVNNTGNNPILLAPDERTLQRNEGWTLASGSAPLKVRSKGPLWAYSVAGSTLDFLEEFFNFDARRMAWAEASLLHSNQYQHSSPGS